MKTIAEILGELRAITDAVEAAGRTHLTEAEDQSVTALEAELRLAEVRHRTEDGGAPIRNVRLLPGWDGTPGPRGNALMRSHRLADHAQITPEQRQLGFGKYIRGLVTGNWAGAEEERAMSIGTGSAGGNLVPTPLAANVIDQARNQSRVMQAGALTVPMESATLKLARIASDPTGAWYAENTQVAMSDPTLDVLTLSAKTMAGLVTFSRQLFEDVDNLDAMLTTIFAEVMALKLDAAVLYGGDTNGPNGLMASSVSTTSMGTNGAALTNYDPFVDAIYAVQSNNFDPNAAIYAPRTARDLNKLKDANDNPLQMPPAVAALQHLVTKQVPIDRTQGTAENASDAFVGQWDQALIGTRTDFTVQLLDQRYADYIQIGMLFYLRADVAFARLGAFNAIVGIIPPA